MCSIGIGGGVYLTVEGWARLAKWIFDREPGAVSASASARRDVVGVAIGHCVMCGPREWMVLDRQSTHRTCRPPRICVREGLLASIEFTESTFEP